MRGILNIIIGLVFVVGGMSGKMVFRGTGSGGLLAVVGLGLIGLGVWRMVQASGGSQAQLPPQNANPGDPQGHGGHAPSWDQPPATAQKSGDDVLKPPTGS